MAKPLRSLINNYIKYIHAGDGERLSKLYKLPAVLKGLDGEYLCLRDHSQLSKYIAAKFALLGKDASVEYIGDIGPHFSLLKEVRRVDEVANFSENGIIVKKVDDKYWIVGESDIN